MKHVSDLLGSLMERKHIRAQVEAARIVEAANVWLEETVPSARRDDVCAMSVQQHHLFIACTSSASAAFVNDRAAEAMEYICRKLPAASVTSIRTRLVSELNSHEF